jgi:pantetheine-phosphate adenylyltransferase
MKIAVFPGTFDPVTIGHQNIIDRGLSLFDELYIAIGVNPNKKTYFDLESRIGWLNKLYESNPKVKVRHYEGLTIDFCKDVGANYVLRGLRSFEDFEYEKRIALVNKELSPNLETVFLYSTAEFGSVSSSFVREILSCGGDVSSFVPKSLSGDIK